ncbi:MAG: YdcF family protein [Bacteroidia bacterium]
MKRIITYIILILFALEITGCISFSKTPHRLYNKALRSGKTFDAVIIPGVPFRDTSWSFIMKTRVLWSYILYKNGMAKNIIYSGAAVYSPYKEALVMGEYAQQLGIPKEHIFYDTCARHSTENVFYSYLIAKKEGFKTVALATDPLQSFFLKPFLRKHFKTRIYNLPYLQDSLSRYDHLNPKINCDSLREPHSESFRPITQKESLPHRLKGTLGKEIDWRYMAALNQP